MSLLEIQNLSIHFGGVKAVQNVTFSVENGDFIGLIGPNGAGKTTVFNAVTGVVPPTLGEIYFDGQRLGIARTFQNIRIYPRMTALENVAIGLDSRASYNTVSAMLRLPHVVKRDKEIKQTCLQYLDQVGLIQHRDTEVGSLPYGLQRKVEIARALATRPKLLFLDEPAAGMNTAESLELVDFLRKLHRETGIAIVLIEHHLEVVMEVCRNIQVLNLGQLLASGTPEEIQKNPDVIKAYLGERRKRGGEAN